MDSHVTQEPSLGCKLSRALVTGKWSFLRVSPHVRLEIAPLSEFSGTQGARKWLFACVHSHVTLTRTAVGKFARAKITRKRFLSRVTTHMLGEMTSASESLEADVA